MYLEYDNLSFHLYHRSDSFLWISLFYTDPDSAFNSIYKAKNTTGVPVAQWLEHCVSSAKVVGSIPREHMYWLKNVLPECTHCKSLWIKASAKCINVNVNVKSKAFPWQSHYWSRIGLKCQSTRLSDDVVVKNVACKIIVAFIHGFEKTFS